ncbi:unnamed protein product [Gongylonema pulchrum]|uniref:Uncharacterized protein n=1 Tax=Gongylonema pulchrum TaxID=637853 RepID=A0A3P6RC34_9BILA|nr:unnamed protein product [Gongylonema pulchrum]
MGDKLHLHNGWENVLCDYIAHEGALVRKAARKLLLLMCNSDVAKYRQIRDEHLIRDLLANLKRRLDERANLEYFELCDIVTRINGISAVSEKRCVVWQRVCLNEVSFFYCRLGF